MSEAETPRPAEGEILYGVESIASFLGMPKRAAQHQIDSDRLPHFHMGRVVCARRERLRSWLAELEASAGAGAAS